MSHTKHSETPEFLWGVKHYGRESRRHLGVESDLNTGLDLVFAFNQQIQYLFSVDHTFSEICHQTNQGCVPFVRYFGECSGTY